MEVTEQTRLITGVTKPTLTLYRPPKDKDTKAAMLICPGGGYWDLYWQLEGEEVAEWLNSIGVTGVILKLPGCRGGPTNQRGCPPDNRSGFPKGDQLSPRQSAEWALILINRHRRFFSRGSFGDRDRDRF